MTQKCDLPQQLQDDPENKWTTQVLPSLLLWCGDQVNVWTIPDSELTHVVGAIIQHVYPLASFDIMQNYVIHGSVIYNLVHSHCCHHLST